MNFDELSLPAVLDAIDAPVFIVRDAIVMRANVAAARLSGYGLDDLVGMPLKGLVHADYAAPFSANLEMLIPFETRLLTADQTPLWVRWTPKRILWQDNPLWVMTVTPLEDQKHLESELNYQKQLYRAFFDQGNDGVHLIDLDSRIISGNQRAAELYRMPIEEMIGRLIYDFIAEEDHPKIAGSGERLIESGHLPIFERRLKRGDGSVFLAEVNLIMVYDDDGEPLVSHSVVRDITERRAIEEKSRENEERLLSTLRSIDDLVFILDRDGVYRDYYQPDKGKLFVPPEEFLGKRVDQIGAPPELVDQFFRAIAALETSDSVHSFDYELPFKGGMGWFNAKVSRLKGAKGEFSGVTVVVRDITERKHIEQRLAESEAMFRGMFESAAVGVVISTFDGKITYANPIFEEMTGYNLNNNPDFNWRLITHPDDMEKEAPLMNQLFAGEIDHYQMEKRYVDINGRIFWVRLTVSLVHEPDGTPRYGVAVVEDINERKRMEETIIEEERLRVALLKEQELSDMKTQMMIRISHEFRTPLSIILSSAEILERYFEHQTPEKRRARLDGIRVQIQHLAKMLDDISLIIRGLTGSENFRPMTIDLGVLCIELVEEMRIRESNPHRIILRMSAPIMLISGDEQAVRIILRNILANALKYSSSDSEIRLEVDAWDEGGAVVRITDFGIGIPLEEQSRIFEPFYRASNVGEKPGLGIGLGLVRDLVEQHGGRVEVESSPEIGTIFTVWLPFAR